MTDTQGAISRRSFVNLVSRGVLWLSGIMVSLGLIRYLSYQPQVNRRTIFELGPASQFPPGSITPIPEAKAFVVATPNALQAFSRICPHLGCEVQLEAQRFTCPCHGSRFAIDGSLINGPATAPLVRLVLETGDTGEVVLKLAS